jgi:CRISPR/Cas system-associated exonuclease Cas4 (RecB family)
MINRPHWSFSALNQYLRCPLQFFFERVLGLPQPTISSSLVLGSAVHRTLESYHRGLMQGRIAGIDELRPVFLDAWESREKAIEITYRNGDNRDDTIQQGLGLIGLYLNEPPPQNIVAIEQQMIVPLHDCRGHYLETPLVAVIDLLTRIEGGLKVTEFKTSGRAYGDFEAESSLQPTCYVNAVHEMYGELATVEFAVLVKTKTPKLQRIVADRNDDDLSRLGELVQTVERAVAAKVFYPVESPMNCSTCPYREPCQQWGRPTESRIEVVKSELAEVVRC